MAVDVVDAILRVVLDDENRHVLPERRVRKPVDDLAEPEVVVGDARAAACTSPATCPACDRSGESPSRGSASRASLPSPRDARGCRRPSSTSGTSCVQPGYSRTSSRSSDGMSDFVLNRFLSVSRWNAKSVGRSRYCASIRRRTLSDETLGAGAYSPNIATVFFFARAASHRNPPDEYVSASISLRRIAPSIVERPHRILGLVRLREPLVAIGRVATRCEEVIERHESLEPTRACSA